ncbi:MULTISPECIES: NAD(P)-dependent oxidoreductase [unclassified Arthrobacter]|uniref:NAD-dependent epimerase/dehydratase family protein n=1 Tax=unclassified Arthrobacter TaxID=235627 RepID=UPI001C85FCA1|nr:NAD-dependent epimerase/dehydratase family protein [Arthrobacter sp. MAHUQ-56]MBX7445440.1 NAD-dependent epimerase/dehydratase family protein [Arthrobacter sp. MAHUQ-56]
MPDPVWVVGAGGLLGRGLVSALRTRGHEVLTTSIPWLKAEDAKVALRAGAEQLRDVAGGRPWVIAWCAGAGVTGTSQQELDSELDVFNSALNSFAKTLCGPDSAPGRFFLASSAGGVYAGSPNPPYSEESAPQPLAPYGFAKLAAEQAVAEFAAISGTRALIGRVANLYGPGQNLAKPQGLISVFAKAYLTGQPVSVYVSLDTLRDYIFIEDAAALIADCLDRLSASDVVPGQTVTKIIATQRADTIGALIGACKTVFKRKPRIVLGASPFAKAQAHDLRLRSVIWTELDNRQFTPLPVGIDATVRDMQALRSVSGSL